MLYSIDGCGMLRISFLRDSRMLQITWMRNHFTAPIHLALHFALSFAQLRLVQNGRMCILHQLYHSVTPSAK